MENSFFRKSVVICIIIIFMLGGYLAGYSKGTYDGVKFAISVGVKFVDIDFNEGELIQIINQYRLVCKGSFYKECLEDIEYFR